MKKTTLVLASFAMILASCSNNGNEAEVKEAEEVTVEKTEVTTELTTVSESSNIDWRASHLGGVQPRYGTIKLASAELLVNDNELTNASIIIDMASLTVDNFEDDEDSKNKLTGHLMNADFFNVEAYPTAKFELTNISNEEGDYNSNVTGNLTIMEATKSITFKANVNISDSEVNIKSEDFSIDRTLWNLTYNVEGTEGVPADYLIANDIGFTIDVTVNK